MKIANIRLLQEPDKSFIVYKESNPFSQWHHHPEYELVLITKGRGKRMVGDTITRFEANDLVLVGPFTPHEWLCDPEYFSSSNNFTGEGIVIQFQYDFLGEKFFEVPENAKLKNLLLESSRGYEFYGNTKSKIISIILKMLKMSNFKRLQSLIYIFGILHDTKEFNVLASPSFNESYSLNQNEPMRKALKFVLQNFHNQIQVKDMLEVTNISASSFSAFFKNAYKMPFKEYLLNIRVGYACKLLTENKYNISEVAFQSGFENISNFNRQFKKIKGITPSQFLNQVNSMET
jgi:AraC-like DNA-binding protein